jgi:hypothetical protein
LQLDHINGINNDSRLENLRFLCPNCHSQTSNYGGRAARIRNDHCYCGKKISGYVKNGKCGSCSQKNRIRVRKVERPTKEELYNLIWSMPTSKIAEDYKVSDKAIEKWCKSYEINKPPRGYWMKNKYVRP